MTNNDEPEQLGSLVGLYFITYDIRDGKKRVRWPGVVIGCPQPGHYLVRTFSLDGRARSDIQIAAIHNMTEWGFFRTCEAMMETLENSE